MVYFLATLLMTIFLTNEYVRPEGIFIRHDDVILRFWYEDFNANFFVQVNMTSYILL